MTFLNVAGNISVEVTHFSNGFFLLKGKLNVVDEVNSHLLWSLQIDQVAKQKKKECKCPSVPELAFLVAFCCHWVLTRQCFTHNTYCMLSGVLVFFIKVI